MKICLDASSIIYETGVSTYTRNLAESLVSIDKRDEFILFGGSLRRFNVLKHDINKFKNVTGKIYPLPPSLLDYLWNVKHVFPVDKFIGKVDVFHSSDWTQPPTQAYKVTTIHDLVPLRFPKISHPKIVSVHKRRLNWVKKEVDKIIAVSEFTKKEIMDLLEIDSKRIVVIPEAPDKLLKVPSSEQIQEVLRKYGILSDYLLVVGADPRKNIENIINSYKKLKRSDIKLVVVGHLWSKQKNVEGVLFLGHVSREELAVFYSQAQALVYVSSYEGFGLPILEAMKLGCPVVTSNLGSMKEVASEAAVLVDAQDVGDISRGIEKILEDRVRWINRGRKHLRKFSWVDTAQKTLTVYKEALK